ncbi:MAG: helical backbone metal receptor [Bacteroidia bacterium]|nr:helical backbone metal receptor [Bacteroidia bacterium]MDW8334139.1 helical backbone metal receptor [Bacteroidia bacterium]
MLYFEYQEPYPQFSRPPRRIVSLCPSLTETLFALGVGERIVGRTKFCVRPRGQLLDAVPKVGGTKTPNIEAIRELNPDCVFAVKEENLPHDVEKIAAFADVVVYDVKDISSALGMIRSLKTILEVEDDLDRYVAQKWDEVRGIISGKAACLVWRKPYMVAGGDTYIHSIITHLGFENIFADRRRYPTIGDDELRPAEFVLFPTEPYPFKDLHIRELDEKQPHSRKASVDGQMITWYGVRMAAAADYFKAWVDDLKSSN